MPSPSALRVRPLLSCSRTTSFVTTARRIRSQAMRSDLNTLMQRPKRSSQTNACSGIAVSVASGLVTREWLNEHRVSFMFIAGHLLATPCTTSTILVPNSSARGVSTKNGIDSTSPRRALAPSGKSKGDITRPSAPIAKKTARSPPRQGSGPSMRGASRRGPYFSPGAFNAYLTPSSNPTILLPGALSCCVLLRSSRAQTSS